MKSGKQDYYHSALNPNTLETVVFIFIETYPYRQDLYVHSVSSFFHIEKNKLNEKIQNI